MQITRLLLPVAAAISITASQVALAQNPWPFYHRGYSRAGQGDNPGPRYIDVKWTAPLGSAVVSANYASPTIDAQGRVYIGTSDGILHVLKADGTPAWQFASGHTKNTVFGNANTPSAAIAPDGTVYVLDPEGYLHKLDSSGNLEWTYDSPGDSADSHPIVHPNGDIIIAVYQYFPPPALGANAYLISLQADKTVNWTQTKNGMGHVLAGPAIDDTGNIYVTAFDGMALGHLWKYDVHGVEQWVYNSPVHIYNTPALDNFGHVLTVDSTGFLVAINSATGQKDWELNIGTFSQASPAVTSDGQILANAYFSSINSINAAGGNLNWKFTSTGRARSGASLDSLGNAYLGIDGGTIWAFSRAGRPMWNLDPDSINTRSTPAFDGMGNLYIATDTPTGPQLICFDGSYNVLRTIGGVKASPNGPGAVLPGKVVTSVGAGFFTVQEFDSSAGIRVNYTSDVAVGDVVKISGTVTNGTAQRVVNALDVTRIGTALLPKPVYMNGKMIGGGTQSENVGPENGIGLNSAALLVKTSGVVGNIVNLDDGNVSFTLDDGSGAIDGAGNNGIKVIAPVAPASTFASVTGVIMNENVNGHIFATIVARSEEDVVNEN